MHSVMMERDNLQMELSEALATIHKLSSGMKTPAVLQQQS